ncbi:hypothetical protein K491DRAFT_38112 [Lophiostoma macrostomum CBS 122681]|uniref:Uncharacterized protein n=1 Tax=Lophiostoma macrostomum CBS 122681 TaxID=1314788 RepID=A0A6A6TP08_9PLEO|nr:hypothetical protein K491DRAFT_38112 [Lophiostoma macrostomum CBS 122681]
MYGAAGVVASAGCAGGARSRASERLAHETRRWRWARARRGRVSVARIDMAVPVETTASVCKLWSRGEQHLRSGIGADGYPRRCATANMGHVPYRNG